MSEDRFAELERRIARLESRVGADAPARPVPQPTSLTAAATGMLRRAKEDDTLGTVGYVGGARLAGGENVWDRQLSLDKLLAADWAPVAGVLESLGSVPRLALLATLVRRGRCSITELQESLGGGEGEQSTSGQLYHHLRALQGARLIVQRRRGEYAPAPQAMTQVLTILAAAFDLANDPPLPLPGHLDAPEHA